MLRVAFSALLTLAACAFPSVAHADTMDTFSLTGNGRDLSFSLPARPSPDDANPGFFFTLSKVSFTEDGALNTVPNVLFYSQVSGGGFSFQNADRSAIFDQVNFFGAQIFSGGVNHPRFKTGDFQLTSVQCSVAGDPDCGPTYNLTISAAAPEPASLVLLGTGALGSIAALRRRFVR